MPSKLVLVSWNDGDGVPVFGGDRPDQGLPFGGGYPSNALPGSGASTLPIFPFDPTAPVGPEPPPTTKPIVPGMKFIVKWLCGVGLVGVPDRPDNTLPATPEPK